MSNYGSVDILWLDGGWVRVLTDAQIRAQMNAPDYKFGRLQSQDIDMPRLVAESRAKQPGLIVVDRDVPGPYQNYLTPEARVPRERALPTPRKCRCRWRGAGRSCRTTHTSRRAC